MESFYILYDACNIGDILNVAYLFNKLPKNSKKPDRLKHYTQYKGNLWKDLSS